MGLAGQIVAPVAGIKIAVLEQHHFPHQRRFTLRLSALKRLWTCSEIAVHRGHASATQPVGTCAGPEHQTAAQHSLQCVQTLGLPGRGTSQ